MGSELIKTSVEELKRKWDGWREGLTSLITAMRSIYFRAPCMCNLYGMLLSVDVCIHIHAFMLYLFIGCVFLNLIIINRVFSA